MNLKNPKECIIQLLADDIDMHLYWKYIKMNHVRWLFRRQIMSKISVVYWSQSGNTATMAEAVAKGNYRCRKRS